jgi:hypothetical protein
MLDINHNVKLMYRSLIREVVCVKELVVSYGRYWSPDAVLVEDTTISASGQAAEGNNTSEHAAQGETE